MIIKEGAYIASEGGQAVSIATANGSDIVMGAGSTVKTTGNVAITSDTGNISLSRIVSADPSLDYDGNSLVTTSGGVTVSTAGKITDGESGSVASVETANIETLGSISLTAGGGIGTTSDSFVIKSNTINSLVSGSGNISVDLQKLSGSNITINEISAHDVDLSAKTAIVIGSSSSSAGMTVSGDLAIALESGTLTQNAAIASAGTVTLDMAADTKPVRRLEPPDADASRTEKFLSVLHCIVWNKSDGRRRNGYRGEGRCGTSRFEGVHLRQGSFIGSVASPSRPNTFSTPTK